MHPKSVGDEQQIRVLGVARASLEPLDGPPFHAGPVAELFLGEVGGVT